MSEARQKAKEMDVSTDVELVKASRREKQQEQEYKDEKAAKLGTKAGQENKNIYDTLADVGRIFRDYNRVKTSEAKRIKRRQENQNQQLAETINKVSENPGKYVVKDPETGQTRPLIGKDIDRMKGDLAAGRANLKNIDNAIEQGTENIENLAENIKDLKQQSLKPQLKKQYTYRTSPPPQQAAGIDPMGGEAYLRRLAPEGPYRNDVLDTGSDKIRAEQAAMVEAQRISGALAQDRLALQTDILADKQELYFQNQLRQGYETVEKRREAAYDAKIRGDNIEAGVKYGNYALSRILVGAFNEASTPIRPVKIAEDVNFLKGVATDPEQRSEAWLTIKADPAGAIYDVAGGLLGGAVVGDLFTIARNRVSSTEAVQVRQLQDVEVRAKWLNLDDADFDISQKIQGNQPRYMEIELTPKVKTRTKRVPKGLPVDAPDIEIDTLLGVAEQRGAKAGFKLGLTETELNNLYEGKTIRVKGLVGEIENLPDTAKPIIVVEEIPSNPVKGADPVKRLVETDPTDIFKETGVDTPYTPGKPVRWLNVDDGFNFRVVGQTGKQIETLDISGAELIKTDAPGDTKPTPWRFPELDEAADKVIKKAVGEAKPGKPGKAGSVLSVESKLVEADNIVIPAVRSTGQNTRGAYIPVLGFDTLPRVDSKQRQQPQKAQRQTLELKNISIDKQLKSFDTIQLPKINTVPLPVEASKTGTRGLEAQTLGLGVINIETMETKLEQAEKALTSMGGLWSGGASTVSVDPTPRRRTKRKKRGKKRKGVYELRVDKAFDVPDIDLDKQLKNLF